MNNKKIDERTNDFNQKEYLINEVNVIINIITKIVKLFIITHRNTPILLTSKI